MQLRPIIISSPTRVLTDAFNLFFVSGAIWRNLGASGVEFIVGLAGAGVIGVPVGLAAGWFRRLEYALNPFLSAANATPLIVLAPLLVVWIGLGIFTRIVIVFMLAVVPLTMNAIAGVKSVDPRLGRVAKSFGASEFWMFKSLALPSATPFVLAGFRLAIGRAMVGIVVGELFAASAGIGYMINLAGATFKTDTVFVGVILIAVVGFLATSVVHRLERMLDSWRPDAAWSK